MPAETLRTARPEASEFERMGARGLLSPSLSSKGGEGEDGSDTLSVILLDLVIGCVSLNF